MKLEHSIASKLKAKKLTLTVAESCTAGLLGFRLTKLSGSSDYFLGGCLTYSNTIKHTLLGVKLKTLKSFGAVSKETAMEMAKGVRLRLGSHIGLSITGIAGPNSDQTFKPVGLVFIAFSSKSKQICQKFQFEGTRHQIRTQSAEAALKLLNHNL